MNYQLADPLLTIDEAAEILRRPVGTLRDWRLKGTGPRSVRIGGRVYYRRSDIETWINQQFDKPAA